MTIPVREEPIARLAEVARIPSVLQVESVLDVAAPNGGLGGIALAEVAAEPWLKDYDAPPGDPPAAWPDRFDVRRWGLLVAGPAERWSGAAVVAFGTPELVMFGGRTDRAVLWDIRVAPDSRRHGIGRALFRAAERWAHARGARHLQVETQNVNVPACRFYAAMGCELAAVVRFAYPELPDEVQLIWQRELA